MNIIKMVEMGIFGLKQVGAYIYARNGKQKGLSDFKKSFGCQLHPIYRGEYIIS